MREHMASSLLTMPTASGKMHTTNTKQINIHDHKQIKALQSKGWSHHQQSN
jgi:hypothetical protein